MKLQAVRKIELYHILRGKKRSNREKWGAKRVDFKREMLNLAKNWENSNSQKLTKSENQGP